MHRLSAILFAACCLTLASCINEDLSDCGSNYGLEYQVTLTTNVQTEIHTELTTETEVEVGKQLLSALSDFFAEYANDVDLNFYNLAQPQTLRHNEHHYIGGAYASYTIYLPAEDYRHLSVANLNGEPLVNIEGNDPAERFNMIQQQGDTIDSHTYGLFSARRDMQVVEGIDQVFDVSLYMQNCAAALVVEPTDVVFRHMEVYLTDLATSFEVNDSIYHYDASPMVRTHKLDTGNRLLCHYGMGFPSAEVRTTRNEGALESLWRIKAYVTLPSGSITETTLYISTPLQAGQLRIIKATLKADGSLTPVQPEVGASVELDWKQGGIYEPEL